MHVRKNGQHVARTNFARSRSVLDYPDFLDVQLGSYEDFVQAKLSPDQRSDGERVTRIFKSQFPIEDTKGRYTLEFFEYSLGAPKHTIEECLSQGLLMRFPLKPD